MKVRILLTPLELHDLTAYLVQLHILLGVQQRLTPAQVLMIAPLASITRRLQQRVGALQLRAGTRPPAIGITLSDAELVTAYTLLVTTTTLPGYTLSVQTALGKLDEARHKSLHIKW